MTIKCPKCKSKDIRSTVAETCRVVINPKTGGIDALDDFWNDGVDDNALYCENCGNNLELKRNKKKEYCLVESELKEGKSKAHNCMHSAFCEICGLDVSEK